MINITKQGNNVIVTSDNPNSFYIGNGELSVPLNTIYYVLDDESDFIQFNSTEEGRILFNGTIGQIQVNGNIVNRENILMELDNVFNSAATGGEGGTAGVLSINGYDGYINLKSVNGQSLIGSGDITIEGGGSTPEQYVKMIGEEYTNNFFWYMNQNDEYREIKFKTINGNTIMGEGNITVEGGEGGTAGVNRLILGEEDYGWNAYQGNVKLKNGFLQFEEGDTGYDVSVGGTDVNGNESGSMWFGFRSTDGSILLEDGGGRLNLKVNPDILGGGGSSSEEIPTVQTGDTGTSSNYIYSDATPKNGVVAFISNQRSGDGHGTYSGITYRYWNDVASNRFVTLDWTGTQAQYDALGEYSDYITYNIIEEEE